jgi:hypothetical protein
MRVGTGAFCAIRVNSTSEQPHCSNSGLLADTEGEPVIEMVNEMVSRERPVKTIERGDLLSAIKKGNPDILYQPY